MIGAGETRPLFSGEIIMSRNVEDKVEDIMDYIDDLCGSEAVSKEEYIEVLEDVRGRCKTNIEVTQEEIEAGER